MSASEYPIPEFASVDRNRLPDMLIGNRHVCLADIQVCPRVLATPVGKGLRFARRDHRRIDEASGCGIISLQCPRSASSKSLASHSEACRPGPQAGMRDAAIAA